MNQAQASIHFKSFVSKFCKNSLGIKTGENSEGYFSNHESKDTFPRKFFWLIHSINPSNPCKSTFSLSNNEGQVLIEFQSQKYLEPYKYSHATFKISSSTHPNKCNPIFEKMTARISVFGRQPETIHKSDWTPCKTPATIQFDGDEILTEILEYTNLLPDFHSHGEHFKNVLLCGIELDFIDKGLNLGDSSVLKPAEHTHQILSKMYNKLDYTDVEINVRFTRVDGSETEIHTFAHKTVLAANSGVFDAMLQSSFIENQFSIIEITDFEPAVVLELLKYLYTGEADFDNYALALLKISDKYDIQDLMHTCQIKIADHIPKYGWPCIMEILRTYEHRVPVLKDLVKQYYTKYETTLRSSMNFKNAIKSFPDVFFKIYCDE